MASDHDLDGSASWQPYTNINVAKATYPYSPSVASIASSSSDSIFSIDAQSSQSSETSSEGWSSSSDRISWENELDNAYSQSREAVLQTTEEYITGICNSYPLSQPLSSVHTTVSDSRQHPRRTQRCNPQTSQDGKTGSSCVRPPPSLVRQSERKDNFVDSLVDTTTQMIETIWPLSVLSCSREAGAGGKPPNLIDLRTFVQEVLRRSKTSYSTLQVALYYLVLIQSCIPKHDFTMEQSEDSASCRAMQCGRRMFLAALILASKYLQDRNYSARAWSKISGLQACEINMNELAFLSAVNWKLHIPESVFHRWTDIVLKYSPSAQVNTFPRSSPAFLLSWRSIVPLLTPELDVIPFFGTGEPFIHRGIKPPSTQFPGMSPPSVPVPEDLSPRSSPEEPTPTNPYVSPGTFELNSRGTRKDCRKLPPIPQLGTLPTPQMTPQTGTFCTPAVSASGFCPGRSMSCAMAQIKNTCLARSVLDNPQHSRPIPPAAAARVSTSTPRSSLASSVSSVSSPESIVSDVASRSSRSSSISSVASLNTALQQSNLAAQAARRCANMQVNGLKEEIVLSKVADREALMPKRSLSKSSQKVSTNDIVHDVASSDPECRPCKPREDTREVAAATGPQTTTSPSTAIPRPQKGHKRCRPNSMDLSVQSSVRDMIAPRTLGDITNMPSRNRTNTTVAPDARCADSFLMPKGENNRPSSSHLPLKPVLSGECLPRKRTCAGSDRGGREEARLMMQRLKESESMQRPGMWEGII